MNANIVAIDGAFVLFAVVELVCSLRVDELTLSLIEGPR
jgi:hypothetical protein